MLLMIGATLLATFGFIFYLTAFDAFYVAHRATDELKIENIVLGFLLAVCGSGAWLLAIAMTISPLVKHTC